jgi:hypothetical protein
MRHDVQNDEQNDAAGLARVQTEAQAVEAGGAAQRAAPRWSYDALTAAAESEIRSYRNHPMAGDAVFAFWTTLTDGMQVEADRERLKALVFG